MKTLRNYSSLFQILWTCVLAAAAANVLSVDPVRWSFLILAPAFLYLILRIRSSRENARAHGSWNYGRIPFLILAVLFGILTVLGRTYTSSDNWLVLYQTKAALLSSILQMSGLAVLAYYAIQAFLLLYLRYPVHEGSGKKRLLFWWLVFVLIWLPYLLANYPGHIMGDTCSQIPMAFNMTNKFSRNVVRISEDVMMTNHHPVLHTLMLGGAIRLGRIFFHSDTAGLFLYTLAQYLIITFVYGCAVSFLEEKKAPAAVMVILALIWLLVPNFPEYAILATKDGLFSAFLLLYGVRTAALLTAKPGEIRRKDLIILLLCAIACMLFRNNGFYVIFLSMPFLALALKDFRKQLLLMTLLILVLHLGYNRVLLPALKVTPGSVREVLSIPLQQTARYFVEYPDEVTEEEEEIFNRVVYLSSALKKYTPKEADKVKARFRMKTVTSDDLKDFLKLWGSILVRHPGCCLQATLCSTNGYYSFQDHTAWNYDITSSQKQVKRLENKSGFQIRYPESLKNARTFFMDLMEKLPDNPLIYLLMQAALYNWILLSILFLAFVRRYWKIAALFMPAFIALLTALAGPKNARTYFRYEYPVAVVLPFLVMVLLVLKPMLRVNEKKPGL